MITDKTKKLLFRAFIVSAGIIVITSLVLVIIEMSDFDSKQNAIEKEKIAAAIRSGVDVDAISCTNCKKSVRMQIKKEMAKIKHDMRVDLAVIPISLFLTFLILGFIIYEYLFPMGPNDIVSY